MAARSLPRYVPGVMKDLRSAASVRRASEQPGGDFEAIAGNVVRRRTGADVTLQDDGKQNGTPDLLIDYPDGHRAIGEVTTLRDSAHAQTFAELTTNGRYPRTANRRDLTRIWTVTIRAGARVKDILRQSPRLLRILEDEGVSLSDLREYSSLLSTSHPVITQLSQLGVVEVYSQALSAGEPGALVVHVDGISASVGPHWEELLDTLEAALFSDGWQDNRDKLAGSGLAERHLLVEISFGPPGEAWFALSLEHRGLPARAPALPEEVTHLWVMATSGRCLAWWPETGWQDVADRWVPD
jgi:hypothetical protein